MNTRGNARAIADVTGGLVLATVEIAAPVERVFRALTTDEITKWWGSSDTYRTTGWSSKLEVGGSWKASGVGKDGSEFSVGGEYLEIDPPQKIVQTWKPDWEEGAATKLTYRLERIETGTRVTVRHEGFGDRVESCRSHANGWERVLTWLTGYASPTPELRYQFARLLPPRPTFAMDMTDAERAVMMAHQAYWRELLAKGTAIVFGPVLDPKAPFGVGIARVKDEAQMKAIEAGDPAITSGIGMRYEVLPMMSAVHA